MKKANYRIAAAAMLLALTFPASALGAESTVSTIPGNTNIDVQARYEDNTDTETVYKVDVSWGSMQFTYSESGTNTWNPETHEYELDTTNGWSAEGNTVTVTNHSNTAVTAQLSFQASPEYSVTGSFDKTLLNLDTAVGTTVDSAPHDTAALTLSGALDESATDFRTIGQITVSIE